MIESSSFFDISLILFRAFGDFPEKSQVVHTPNLLSLRHCVALSSLSAAILPYLFSAFSQRKFPSLSWQVSTPSFLTLILSELPRKILGFLHLSSFFPLSHRRVLSPVRSITDKNDFARLEDLVLSLHSRYKRIDNKRDSAKSCVIRISIVGETHSKNR